MAMQPVQFLQPYIWSTWCLRLNTLLEYKQFNSHLKSETLIDLELAHSLPGELRLAPHAPSLGWHVLIIIIVIVIITVIVVVIVHRTQLGCAAGLLAQSVARPVDPTSIGLQVNPHCKCQLHRV